MSYAFQWIQPENIRKSGELKESQRGYLESFYKQSILASKKYCNDMLNGIPPFTHNLYTPLHKQKRDHQAGLIHTLAKSIANYSAFLKINSL